MMEEEDEMEILHGEDVERDAFEVLRPIFVKFCGAESEGLDAMLKRGIAGMIEMVFENDDGAIRFGDND